MGYRRYGPPQRLLIGYDPVRDLPSDHLARLVARLWPFWRVRMGEQAVPGKQWLQRQLLLGGRMLTPSLDILPWLAGFAPAMTAPTFANALTLCVGTLLTPGARTVTAALRVLGLAECNFSKYHRVCARASWSALQLSRLLLHQLIATFVPPGEPLQL